MSEKEVYRLEEMSFTFEDDGVQNDDEREKAAAVLAAALAEAERLDKINLETLKRITTFLNRLKGDPEKNVINWSGKDRHSGINKFLADLNELRKQKEPNE